MHPVQFSNLVIIAEIKTVFLQLMAQIHAVSSYWRNKNDKKRNKDGREWKNLKGKLVSVQKHRIYSQIVL